MKLTRNNTALIILSLATLVSTSFGQGVNVFSGKVFGADVSEPLGLINFAVTNSTNNETMVFEIWAGQFGVANAEQLLDKDLSITYVKSVAPLSVGIRESSKLYEGPKFYEELIWKPDEFEMYNFLGQFKEAISPNYQLALVIEGAQGRVEEFAVPREVDPQRFYDGEYDGVEVIVTYIMVDEIVVADLRFGEFEELEIEDQQTQTFTGVIKDLSDSGLGPMYNIEVKNSSSEESMYGLFNRYDDLSGTSDEDLLGKKVKLYYSYDAEYRMSTIELKAKAKNNKDTDPETIFVEGEFDFCQVGDVDGYLYILVAEDEAMEFLTGFYCPDDIKKGDKVIVGYTVEQVLNIQKVEILK